jgi:hypothetical protein
MQSIHYGDHQFFLESNDPELIGDELWFVAKNVIARPELPIEEIIGYSKLHSMNLRKGCLYDKDIMEKLEELRKGLYV